MKKQPRPLTGRHVLLMMVAFFTTVFAANFYLVYMARTTFNGLSETQAYEKGLAYNEVLERARVQEESGWTSHAEYANGTVSVHLADQNGPVEGARCSATLYRVTTRGEDVTAALLPAPETPGLYTAALKPPRPGLWELRIAAKIGERTFESRQRMDIR